MTAGELYVAVHRLAFQQGTLLWPVHKRDGGTSYLTRRVDGGSIEGPEGPPIYSSLAAAYLSLTTPKHLQGKGL